MDRDRLLEFDDDAPPPGESPWVAGAGPGRDLTIVEHDPRWAEQYADLAGRIRRALCAVALRIEHVGSTSVSGLPAKPIVDVDVTVPDPDDEAAYVPALEAAGFVLAVREPWWQGHRLLRHADPRANVHVFGPEAAEPQRHLIFREWLRTHPQDRERYAAAKRAAAAAGGHVMEYNARKQEVLREILVRAINRAG
ncbi:GrpB family protein [Aeromicrobium duanguangcaii]|uniref:GrpB family protein n=1 Tax=Aeromicrobium duanguangcaii TaxID=2968086 RepID=UPI00201769DC|nr:GrpB family protein [Aeromicrobium duanguangcaii]